MKKFYILIIESLNVIKFDIYIDLLWISKNGAAHFLPFPNFTISIFDEI